MKSRYSSSPFPQFWINDNPLLLRWRGRHALLSMLHHLFLIRGHLGDSCHGCVRVLRLGCGDNSWKLRGTKVVRHACVSVQKSDSWVHMKVRGWDTVRAVYLFRVMAGTCREAISNFEWNRNRWNSIAEKMRHSKWNGISITTLVLVSWSDCTNLSQRWANLSSFASSFPAASLLLMLVRRSWTREQSLSMVCLFNSRSAFKIWGTKFHRQCLCYEMHSGFKVRILKRKTQLHNINLREVSHLMLAGNCVALLKRPDFKSIKKDFNMKKHLKPILLF